MRAIIDVLAGNPLLLLFAVVAVGYPIGRLHVKGVSLGVAAISSRGSASVHSINDFAFQRSSISLASASSSTASA